MEKNDDKTLQILLKNLQDLNNISLKISNELEDKNRILRGSIQDCETCRTFVDNSIKTINDNK